MTTAPDVAPEIVARLGSMCLALPEAYEEQAWVGTRWRIRKRTFAHVLTIDAGWPPAYARAAATDGPCAVLTFRSTAPEIPAFRDLGHPFFVTGWGRDCAGGAVLVVLVQPRASRTRVVGEHDGRIKVQLAAPPVDGEANAALLAFLADACGVKRADVALLAGESGRRKRVRITGADAAAVAAALLPAGA